MASLRYVASGTALRILRRLPFVKHWAIRRKRYLFRYPPGHFYSPIPNVDEMLEQGDAVFPALPPASLPGLMLRDENQLHLLRELAVYVQKHPFPQTVRSQNRYYFDNPYFRYADGLFLYAMIRHFKPKRIIEVGSGFSSAAMLDTDEIFSNRSIEFTFIEPNPQRLIDLLREDDGKRVRIIQQQVQHVPLDLFDSLSAGDMLFIDSSHVAKVGSDVNHLMFEVLPRLTDGVLIHFHDVFYPFQYPRNWIVGGLAWNEAYLLRAFLQFNERYEILLFNDYLAKLHREELTRHAPPAIMDTGGSLWLRKLPNNSAPPAAIPQRE